MVEEGVPVPPIRESPPAFIPHSSNRQDAWLWTRKSRFESSVGSFRRNWSHVQCVHGGLGRAFTLAPQWVNEGSGPGGCDFGCRHCGKPHAEPQWTRVRFPASPRNHRNGDHDGVG